MKGTFRVAIVSVGLIGGMAANLPAHAAPIFSDDFNRADGLIVGNGWVENEGGALHISIVSQHVEFSGHDQGDLPDGFLAQISLSTVGYTSILLDYSWGARNGEPDEDQLLVEWKRSADAAWLPLATHNLAGQALAPAAQIALPVSADNVSIDLRFAVNTDMGNDTALLDNVAVSGTRVVITEVPEPATLALVGFGLLGLGACRRARMIDRVSAAG